mmetsp:Transcript_5951/g.7493  ORF Transcript_5951/g.7493 Transcript_5951/m.7493 type:complete len:335 (+) Transcript_5951:73-1077(+)|eukprot:CAMPEP_0204826130 /NCGR_PEP_ID=MMETSP1346-20131115/3872_1 /ASSEMBLY_ACC=CAM_ASM_000771 /TAXON_ID=215587 /ORGANISM="Aplanochytrium stocchinoi, Strain GSBS06" /LENGTH=334 /DNA_ID=CAMNT_0051954013 /DNA_START=161 /DNA_END=1165 /DNA_ORIENTATION=-
MGNFTGKPAARKNKYFDAFEEGLPSMNGKVVVITGTTSGTGFVAANTVAKKGGKVVVLNRKSSRAEESLQKLREANPDAEIEWVECDLQNFESVRAAADELKRKFADGIDVMCNNAGVMALEDRATVDGYDVQMQTNHLSHFLLNKELYPLLTKTANEKGEARIVNHSSGARNHPSTPLKAEYFGKNGGNLGGNGNSLISGGARWERYHQTKLANSCYTHEFTKRAEASGSKVIMVTAHPGLSSTNLQVTTNAQGGMDNSMFNRLFMYFSQSPEDGTMGLLQGICGEGVKAGDFWGPKGITGKAVLVPPGKLTNDNASQMLWEESEKAVGSFAV